MRKWDMRISVGSGYGYGFSDSDSDPNTGRSVSELSV